MRGSRGPVPGWMCRFRTPAPRRVRRVDRRWFLMVMARRIWGAGGRDGGVTGDRRGEQGRGVVLFTSLACIMTWQGSFISGIAIGRMKDILVVEAAICSGEITMAWITDFRSGWRGRAGCGRSGQTKRVRGPEVRLDGRASLVRRRDLRGQRWDGGCGCLVGESRFCGEALRWHVGLESWEGQLLKRAADARQAPCTSGGQRDGNLCFFRLRKKGFRCVLCRVLPCLPAGLFPPRFETVVGLF
ncbi:hypothetical protein K456DRAFT_1125969 [Colletotrichum gloeosporioides 23]|nr:hypothetical protein K456DRAFT_1125969 [Colletotrichum gloeosporioides 23]